MPKIPTVALSALPMAGALGPMANEGTANAVNQSIAQAGSALGQVANQIFNIAQKRQEHINKGILANEEVIFEKTQQEIMRQAEENRANPEKIPAMAEATWAQYNAGRDKRAAEQGYTREIADTLSNRYSVGIERFNTMFAAKVQGIQIQQANGRFMSLAEQKASQGDLPGAFEELNKLNVFPAEMADLKEKFALKDIVDKTNAAFNSIGQGSPSMQIEQYTQLANYFTAKDEKGNFTFNGYNDNDGNAVGTLPLETRNQIVAKANALLAQAQNQELSNIKPVLKVFEENGNELGNQALQQAVLAGNISQATADRYASTFSATATVGQQERTLKDQEVQKATMRRQNSAFEALSSERNLTTERITQNVESEAISPEQGKRLMGVVTSTAISQLDPANPLLTDRGDLYMGTDPRTYLQSYIAKNKDINKEGTVADKEKLLQAINDSPLSAEAKRRITREALDFFTIDFRDAYKSTAPIKKGGLDNFFFHRGTRREISPREADVRSFVYRNMRNQGDLGKPFTISFLIEAERQITSHFENKNNGEVQHAALEKGLEYRAQNFSGHAIVHESLFP